jgi:hypothetical protein
MRTVPVLPASDEIDPSFYLVAQVEVIAGYPGINHSDFYACSLPLSPETLCSYVPDPPRDLVLSFRVYTNEDIFFHRVLIAVTVFVNTLKRLPVDAHASEVVEAVPRFALFLLCADTPCQIGQNFPKRRIGMKAENLQISSLLSCFVLPHPMFQPAWWLWAYAHTFAK